VRGKKATGRTGSHGNHAKWGISIVALLVLVAITAG